MISYFIGVDPGASGGIAVIDSSCEVIILRSMPDSERDTWELVDSLPHGRVLIEKVHAMPGQGVTSMFTFGRNVGLIVGCLTAAELPFEEVTPQKWQAGLSIPKKNQTESHTQFKSRMKNFAQRMFPELHITLKTCDALLIAEYLRRSRS